MSSYCVSIGKREYNVKVNGSSLLLDGEPVNFDLVSLNGNGLHVLRRGNQSIELYLSAQRRGAYEVLVGGHRVIAQVDMAGRRRRRRADRVAGDLVAPMPSVVISVLVEAGDVVEKDQVLAVLESMDVGKPVQFARSFDIQFIADLFHFCPGVAGGQLGGATGPVAPSASGQMPLA